MVVRQRCKVIARSRLKLSHLAFRHLRFKLHNKRAEASRPFFTQVYFFLESRQNRPVTYGELVNVAKEQAYGLLILLLSIPSLVPAVNLGAAPIGGLITMWIGIQMTFGRSIPKLPKRISLRQIHKMRLGGALAKIEEYLDRFGNRGKARKRLDIRWVGAMVAWASFLLLIPVPLPFANFIPAAILVLFGAALLEERSGWSWAAAFATLLNTIYFGLFVGLILKECINAIRMIWRWLA